MKIEKLGPVVVFSELCIKRARPEVAIHTQHIVEENGSLAINIVTNSLGETWVTVKVEKLDKETKEKHTVDLGIPHLSESEAQETAEMLVRHREEVKDGKWPSKRPDGPRRKPWEI